MLNTYQIYCAFDTHQWLEGNSCAVMIGRIVPNTNIEIIHVGI